VGGDVQNFAALEVVFEGVAIELLIEEGLAWEDALFVLGVGFDDGGEFEGDVG
jgi:hypothetical protein